MRRTVQHAGHTLRTQSNRRYVVFRLWGNGDNAIYYRSDSYQRALAKAREAQQKAFTSTVVIVDTATGEVT